MSALDRRYSLQTRLAGWPLGRFLNAMLIDLQVRVQHEIASPGERARQCLTEI